MNINFDHISLSAKEPEKIKDFLIELLDLKVGSRPKLKSKGYFLFSGERELIHIFPQKLDARQSTDAEPVQAASNIVHHAAFWSDDYDEVIARITKLDAQYSTKVIPDTNITQLFVQAPESSLA